MSKPQIKIHDACFHKQASMSAKGENTDLQPKHFEWYRGNEERDIVWFTDSCFHLAPETKAKRKVAWLLEPPPFRANTYEYVMSNRDQFDTILTYAQEHLHHSNVHFYPYGGSMIRDWSITPKSKLVSIVISKKNVATGHKLRHEIARCFGDQIDVLGSGYGDYVDKRVATADYHYQIVVEGERLDYCFDEKLIDCFALGTIPIFWGCPSIADFFDPAGLLRFSTLNGLKYILATLDKSCWRQHIGSIFYNLKTAQQYHCVEDWIYEHYPELFI